MDPPKKSLAATERKPQERAEFKAQQAELKVAQLVVLDECGRHTSLTPAYAWSPRGQRAVGSVPRNRGQNMTLLCALTTTSALAATTAMVIDGACERLVFEAYIEKVLAPHLTKGQIVLMDNLPAHKSAKVKQLIEAKECKVLFLPAYSPDLSPIELAFSKLKQYLRRIGARTRAALQRAVGEALEHITLQDAWAYFKHSGYS